MSDMEEQEDGARAGSATARGRARQRQRLASLSDHHHKSASAASRAASARDADAGEPVTPSLDEIERNAQAPHLALRNFLVEQFEQFGVCSLDWLVTKVEGARDRPELQSVAESDSLAETVLQEVQEIARQIPSREVYVLKSKGDHDIDRVRPLAPPLNPSDTPPIMTL